MRRPAAHRVGAWLTVFLCLLFSSGASAAPDASSATFENIDALIASGAWQLAQRSLESFPRPEASFDEELERRCVVVYRNLRDAAALAARIETWPAEVSNDFKLWALGQLAETALAARDLARAETALQQLATAGDPVEGRAWRTRLVRNYLDTGRANDALTALTPLFEHDEARALHAEVLLHLGRDREAFELVAGLTSPEARLWRLIAARRLELYAPADTVQELSLLVRDLRDRPALQRLAWLIRAEAAKQTGQHARRINSLEQAFRLDGAISNRLATVAPDDLWSAYLALARHLAQAESLSLGAAALARADAYRKQDAYSARALYAWNAIEAQDGGIRVLAHERLVGDLAARRLEAVVRALYTGAKRFVSGKVPSSVQRVLMRDALAHQNFQEAARYARALTEPPAEGADFDWQLRRARVMLYGGEQRAAVELLERLIASDEFNGELAPRLLQVVFDMQSLGRHAEALRLLEAVYARVDNARMHRELLYWQAESAAALARHAEAAALYLRSAQYGEEDGTDRWGQSARFRAAEALTNAGLRDDAESLYRGLLKQTADPNRRLLIEQQIERLWLAAPAATTR